MVKKMNRAQKLSKVLLVLGVTILLIFLVFSLFPNQISPYGEKQMFSPWQKPCENHLLGTNDMGYDIFTEIIFATRQTLLVGISSAFFSLVLGVLFGITAGYCNGVVSQIANQIIDVFLLIPKLPLIIVLATFVGATQGNVIFIISILGWVGTARVTRAKAMNLKKLPFVDGLKISGISEISIVTKHILPNVKDVVFARYIMSVTSCIMMESTLSFLGLSDVTKVTWGSMINMAYSSGGFFAGAYNWLLSPGICIMLCVLAFYCVNSYIEIKSKTVENRSFAEL